MVQLEGVRRPNREGLQALPGVLWPLAGFENARFVGGTPVISVEEQPVDGAWVPRRRAALSVDSRGVLAVAFAFASSSLNVKAR